MCRRAHAPCMGLWTLPGGFVELDESADHAASRELQEETGVSVHGEELVLDSVISLPHIGEIYLVFRGVAEDPRIRCGSECLEAAWFDEEDIPWEALAYTKLESHIGAFFRRQRQVVGNASVTAG